MRRGDEKTISRGAVACDLCGASSYQALFQANDRRFGFAGTFTIARCAECGLTRTEPQPVDPSAFYPTDAYYSFAPPVPPSDRRRIRLREAYGLPAKADRTTRLISRLGAKRSTPGLPPGPPGDLLDVGCGSGEFLLALREVGWNCHGVEVSEHAVAAARSAGLTSVQLGEFPNLDYPSASFDVVRFWHSLEHVRSPRLYLSEARRVLRPGGRLQIGVPNFASLLSRTFRDRWFYLDVPRHLWHFDTESLTRLVSDVGFQVRSVEYVTPSTPILGTFLRLLGRDGSLVDQRLLWLSTLPLAVLLDSLALGDGMVTVAKAPD
jgi:SAM-dependent methyltransferase